MSKKTITKLFILYIITLCFLMWFPSQKTGIDIDWYFLGIRSDHWIHALLFTPFMFFCSILFEKEKFLIHFMWGISLAALLESSHYYIPYRTFSFMDFIANLCGLSISTIFYLKKRFRDGY